MTIKEHCKSLTVLSEMMNTDREDCAAWVEEFLIEIRGDDEDKPLFDKLGDNMSEEQLLELTTEVIGHYSKENRGLEQKVKGLLYNLTVF